MKKKKKLVLLNQSKYNDRVITYLTDRGISKTIVEECINKGYIYQTYPHNNVVFVGFDEENNPRYERRLATKALEYSLSDSYKIIESPEESEKEVLVQTKTYVLASTANVLLTFADS